MLKAQKTSVSGK